MTLEKISEKLPAYEAVILVWSPNKVGKFPVKIRVTFNRKPKYYSVYHNEEKLFLNPEEWEVVTVTEKKPRGENKKIKDSIDAALSLAKLAGKNTTANGRQFTFAKFKNNYINKTISGGFIARFESYLQDLLTEGRTGSYIAYKNALSAFKAFRDGKEINPVEINPPLLKSFEAWLRKKKTKVSEKTGKKRITKAAGSTTVAMYMRSIKVVYNLMAYDQPELKQDYPFARKQNEKNKYQIPAGSGSHKGEALSSETLKAFIDTKTDDGTPEHSAKLTFLFSFFCQGMNMRDIASLRYKNIFPDVIRYKREKTKRNESKTQIEIPLVPEIKDIIVELSTVDKDPDNFVFDILNDSMDAMEKDKAVRQFIKVTNKWLEVLCSQNNLPAFTTYSARHSYASLLKQQGSSIEMIRELLGHGDIRTTENYLKRFDLDKKKEANEGIFKVLKSA